MDERAGAWILGELVAAGELGEVRIGRAGDQVAAVKRLHRHAARQPAVRALFVDEIARTRTVPPHPHLIAGLDGDDAAEPPYLVMPLHRGDDLRARLGQPQPTAAVAAVVAGAAAAAAHLHAHGWVHGDAVPGNLLDVDGGPILCDLGVVRALGADGPVRGTAAYMAPEQVRGQAWTGAVDVFALGVIAWELATGARLFHRGASYLSMAAVIEHRPPPLADAALAPLVAAMLAPAPGDRPRADEVVAALGPLAR